MQAYIIRRLGHSILVLLAISLLVFLLVHLTGDPVRVLAPLDASEKDMQNIREQYGLDRPLPVQYLDFLVNAVQGDLGKSFKYRRPALPLVLRRFPATGQIAVTSLCMSIVIGVPFGIITAVRQDSFADYVVSLFSLVSISIPSFWLGMMLIMLFADQLRWLPASGRSGFLSSILPSISLAMYSIGLLVRLVRSNMNDVLGETYIQVARAKGLGERIVLYKHALRNCMLPVVTVLGLQLGSLLGGSVVVESVFAWPGVGWLMLQGIMSRDLPLVRTVVLIVGLAFLLINLLVDVLYVYLDPRVRYS
jgi:ABC-type dipeptide/oligopeptide/nickel transport system permease component